MLTFVGFCFETDIFIVSDDRLESAKSPKPSDNVHKDKYKKVAIC